MSDFRTACNAEEIAEMGKLNLYTSDEIQYFVKRRRELEKKINGVNKSVQDFNEYIKFEMSLLKQIRLRRNGKAVTDKKCIVEYRILERIKLLYEIAIQRYFTDFSLSLAYFKFCKTTHNNNAAEYTIKKLLKNFAHQPEIWEEAATWYFKEKSNIKYAIEVLHMGLAEHKSNETLYLKLIEYELKYLSKTTVDQITESDKTDYCKKIENYITSAQEFINNFSFYVTILTLIEKHSFLISVQNSIVKILLDKYGSEAEVWHKLADRELNGYHYNCPEPKNSQKFRLLLCFKKYREGLELSDDKGEKKCTGENRKKLWLYYLDRLVNLRESETAHSTLIEATLKTEMEYASDEPDVLTEKYYILLTQLHQQGESEGDIAQMLIEDETKNKSVTSKIDHNYLESIFITATKAYPESQDLWKAFLRYTINKDSLSEVQNIFGHAIANLKENALPIWLMFIRYLILTSSDSLIEKKFKAGIKESAAISDALKPRYIEWVAMTKGTEAARCEFQKIVHKTPYCKELLNVMSKIESLEFDIDLQNWEKVLQLACEQFGKDVDVWMNLIYFYIHYNPNNLDENITKAREGAEKNLPEFLLMIFKDKYKEAITELNKKSQT